MHEFMLKRHVRKALTMTDMIYDALNYNGKHSPKEHFWKHDRELHHAYTVLQELLPTTVNIRELRNLENAIAMEHFTTENPRGLWRDKLLRHTARDVLNIPGLSAAEREKRNTSNRKVLSIILGDFEGTRGKMLRASHNAYTAVAAMLMWLSEKHKLDELLQVWRSEMWRLPRMFNMQQLMWVHVLTTSYDVFSELRIPKAPKQWTVPLYTTALIEALSDRQRIRYSSTTVRHVERFREDSLLDVILDHRHRQLERVTTRQNTPQRLCNILQYTDKIATTIYSAALQRYHVSENDDLLAYSQMNNMQIKQVEHGTPQHHYMHIFDSLVSDNATRHMSFMYIVPGFHKHVRSLIYETVEKRIEAGDVDTKFLQHYADGRLKIEVMYEVLGEKYGSSIAMPQEAIRDFSYQEKLILIPLLWLLKNKKLEEYLSTMSILHRNTYRGDRITHSQKALWVHTIETLQRTLEQKMVKNMPFEWQEPMLVEHFLQNLQDFPRFQHAIGSMYEKYPLM